MNKKLVLPLFLSLLLCSCSDEPSTTHYSKVTNLEVLTGALGNDPNGLLPNALIDLYPTYKLHTKDMDFNCIVSVNISRIDGDQPAKFTIKPEPATFLSYFAFSNKSDLRQQAKDQNALTTVLKDPTRANIGEQFIGKALSDSAIMGRFVANLDTVEQTLTTGSDLEFGYDPSLPDGGQETIGTHKVLCYASSKSLRDAITNRLSQTLQEDRKKPHKIFILWLDRGLPNTHGVADGVSEAAPNPVTPPPVTTPIETSPQTPSSRPELSLRVITRPYAKIYSQPDTNSDVVKNLVPAFTIYDVVGKQPLWYEVSERGKSQPIGWLPETNVSVWKQNIVVDYYHPHNRNPVLFFGTKDNLKQIVSESQPQRVNQAQGLYATINSGTIPGDFPVVAVSPQTAIDQKEDFHLLPITDFDNSTEFTDQDGASLDRHPLLLKVNAMTEGPARAIQSTVHTTTITPQVNDLKMDVVFVMDLTKSMGPFAKETTSMMEQIVNKLQQEEGVKFGFWGYRDDLARCKGIGFLTQNYTPTLLSGTDFLPVLGTAKETEVDSIDYEEDVLSGVHDAVQNTKWTDGALHFLILVGDAPGREPNELDPNPYQLHWERPPVGTARGQNEIEIRTLANNQKIYIAPIYLVTPRWSKYKDYADSQWSVLGKNRNDDGTEITALQMVQGGETVDYSKVVDQLTSTLVDDYQQAKQGSSTINPYSSTPVTSDEKQKSVADKDVANNMFKGALLDWIGQRTKLSESTTDNLPSDIAGWAVDKDIVDPSRQSLDVMVYMRKGDLETLKLRVDQAVEAFNDQRTDAQEYLNSLRSIVFESLSGDKAESSDSVSTDVSALPYRSRLLSYSADTLKNLSEAERKQDLAELQSKLKFYQEFYDNQANWIKLHDGDEPDDWVGAVPIGEMP